MCLWVGSLTIGSTTSSLEVVTVLVTVLVLLPDYEASPEPDEEDYPEDASPD